MLLRVLILNSVVACALPCLAKDAKDDSLLTLERIFRDGEFDGKDVNCEWLPKSSGVPTSYSVLEPATEGDGKQIVRYDAETGERTVLVTASDLTPAGREVPLSVEHYQWSKNLSRVLIFTNSVKVWRKKTRGDYWVLDRGTGQLVQLGKNAKPSTLMYAKFSPGGDSVAYVSEGDLYLENLVDQSVQRLTRRENERVFNGMSDWVYEEEFQLRDGFRWSPNGKKIAYWRFDTSGVQDFQLINNTDSLYPTTKTFAYPKAGTRNSDVRVGVLNLENGQTQWVQMPGDSRDHYLPRIQWIEQTQELMVRQMNRLQNRETLTIVNFESKTQRIVFTEDDDAWIDLQDDIKFSDDADSFYYVSDRDGWKRLYHSSVDSDKPKLLTDGDFDVVELLGTASNQNSPETTVYFIASPDSPSERFLYRYQYRYSNGQVLRVTPNDASGVHEYDLSPGGKYAIHTWSTTEQPPVTELVSLPDHKVVRVLESNQELAKTLKGLDPTPAKFFQIDIGDVVLDAWCINPPNQVDGKKYPLLVYVYGEPAGSTVMNRWGGRNAMWHRMMAQRGYVVVSVDNRGTDVPRGREFRKSVYRRLGSLGPDDQAASVRKLLQDRSDLDPKRVGVWGWSGGGTSTLHALFRYPDLYRAGVAVAPVANLNYYDTIYEERYMSLPSLNIKGYREGSAINFASNLKGKLMLMHGTADDNVHYQASELLINELIKQDKPFEMFIYPGRTHSINEGKQTRQHLMNGMTNFLRRTLPGGPR